LSNLANMQSCKQLITVFHISVHWHLLHAVCILHIMMPLIVSKQCCTRAEITVVKMNTHVIVTWKMKSTMAWQCCQCMTWDDVSLKRAYVFRPNLLFIIIIIIIIVFNISYVGELKWRNCNLSEPWWLREMCNQQLYFNCALLVCDTNITSQLNLPQ